MVLFQWCHLSQYFPAGQPDIDTTERNTIYSPVTCNTTHTLILDTDTQTHKHTDETQKESPPHSTDIHPHTLIHTYKDMRLEQAENDTWTHMFTATQTRTFV